MESERLNCNLGIAISHNYFFNMWHYYLRLVLFTFCYQWYATQIYVIIVKMIGKMLTLAHSNCQLVVSAKTLSKRDHVVNTRSQHYLMSSVRRAGCGRNYTSNQSWSRCRNDEANDVRGTFTKESALVIEFISTSVVCIRQEFCFQLHGLHNINFSL